MQELLDHTVVKHLADTGEMLDAVNSDNYPQPKILQSVAFLTNINWVLYLNYCMGDYQELIESFVSDVINLTVRLQRTEKWFCYAVSDVSCQLNVNAELKSLIKANFEIYKGNYYQTSGTVKREGSFPWGWTIWILLICLRAFSHCDKSDPDSQRFHSTDFLKDYEESEESKQRKKQQAHYLDSMIRSQIVDKKRIDSITKSHQVTPPEPENKPDKTDTLGEAIRKLNEAIEKVDVSGGGGAP